MLSSIWLVGLLGLAAQQGPAPADLADPPPPLELEEPATERQEPTVPARQKAQRREAPSADPAATDSADDFPLRVVGAICGGILGFYAGQFLNPLLLIPLALVVVIAALAAPALLVSVPTWILAAVPIAIPCAYVGFPAVMMVLPITGAIIVGTLGYQQAPNIVGNIGRRFQAGPPESEGEAMAY